MNDFMMIFRHEHQPDLQLSPEQLQASIKQWQDWIGGIAAQGKFAGTNQLDTLGKTLHPDKVITDGPYAEVKEIIGGYVLVKADHIDAAVELAQGCPILAIGGTVEVRKIVDMGA